MANRKVKPENKKIVSSFSIKQKNYDGLTKEFENTGRVPSNVVDELIEEYLMDNSFNKWMAKNHPEIVFKYDALINHKI